MCAFSAISPTPDITGPVVGASASDRQRTQTWILDFSFDFFFFSSGFFRLEYEHDVIGAEFVNIGGEILLCIA